jgi:hypothetical protein
MDPMDVEKEESRDDASSTLPSVCRAALGCLEEYVDAVERRLKASSSKETTGMI